MDKFVFTHLVDEDQMHVRVIRTQDLPTILAAFRDFLVAAGFTYVQEVDADCGGYIHCSDDEVLTDEEFAEALEDFIGGELTPTETPFLKAAVISGDDLVG